MGQSSVIVIGFIIFIILVGFIINGLKHKK